MIFKGCGVAIATPFNKNGEIDYEYLKKHIEFLIENKTDCIVACGTTGESATLTKEEKLAFTEFVVKTVNKRIPVMAGTGSNNTKLAVEMSIEMEKLGVDALLVVTPYYNKATQQGLVQYFKTIANSTNLPIMLYNVPSRTGVNMLPSTVFELSKIKNIVALKEACGDISQVAEVIALCGDNLHVYTGNDDQILATIAVGGVGTVSVVANIIPKDIHDMVEEFFKGNVQQAQKMHAKTLGLIKAMFCEVSPVPVKQALEAMNLGTRHVREPLCEIEPTNKEFLLKQMKEYGGLLC